MIYIFIQLNPVSSRSTLKVQKQLWAPDGRGGIPSSQPRDGLSAGETTQTDYTGRPIHLTLVCYGLG